MAVAKPPKLILVSGCCVLSRSIACLPPMAPTVVVTKGHTATRPKDALGYSELYSAIRLILISIVSEIGGGQIDARVTDKVADELNAARDHYQLHIHPSHMSETNDALRFMLSTNKQHVRIQLRNLISLQRFLLGISTVNGDALQVTTGMIFDQIGSNHMDPATRATETEIKSWKAAFKLVGRPNYVDPGGTSGQVTLCTRNNLVDPLRTWSPMSVTQDTLNPMESPRYKQALAAAKNPDKTTANSKRAASLPLIFAYIAAVYASIMQDLDTLGDSIIDQSGNKTSNEALYRKCQVLMFLAIAVTSPARAIEILSHTFDDFTESIKGHDEFPVLFRGLMDKWTLPRTIMYFYRRWFGKVDKSSAKEKANGDQYTERLATYMQDTLPIGASALSLPDLCVVSMTIMLRLQTVNLLSPVVNPGMHIFRGTGTGDSFEPGPELLALLGLDEDPGEDENDDEFAAQQRKKLSTKRAADKKKLQSKILKKQKQAASGTRSVPFATGELTTSRMDSLLQMDIPYGAVRHSGLSGYSFRTGFAVVLHQLNFLGVDSPPERARLVRMWFGHSPTSMQIIEYALTLGRCLSCNICKSFSLVKYKMCVCFRKRNTKV